MIAFYGAASLPAALVAEQNKLRCFNSVRFIRSGASTTLTALASAIPKLLLLSLSSYVYTLAVCRQHHTSLSRTTRPEHMYLCTHQLRSSLVGAGTGPINLVRPSVSASRIT